MNILFIDTETSGLDPKKNCIVEIAAELHVNGQRKTFFTESCYDRDSEVDLGALKVNGKRLAGLNSNKSEEEALRHFCDFLAGLDVKEIVLCGHNVHFDVDFIKTRLAKYKLSGWDGAVSYRHLDTCVLSRFIIASGLLPLELGSRGSSLSSFAKMLSIDTSDIKLHSAHGDVILCSRVYYKLVDTFKMLQTDFGRILYGKNNQG